MSDQTAQTTAKASTEPILCKMGCGFFGNGAMGGCCSKCYRDMMKKEECKVVEQVSKEPMEENVPMDVEPTLETAAATVSVPEQKPAPVEAASAAASNTTPKKKKKKASYKDMMSGIVKTATPDADAKEKQKEQLRKVTGGGAFTKIDKI